MKHIPYRQNPTVIDTSKKARPPPGTSLPLTMNCLITVSYTHLRHGTYALIDKGENRDREIRKPRPSIRAQLKADKARTAPKKAAAKTKNHDMEV